MLIFAPWRDARIWTVATVIAAAGIPPSRLLFAGAGEQAGMVATGCDGPGGSRRCSCRRAHRNSNLQNAVDHA